VNVPWQTLYNIGLVSFTRCQQEQIPRVHANKHKLHVCATWTERVHVHNEAHVKAYMLASNLRTCVNLLISGTVASTVRVMFSNSSVFCLLMFKDS